MKRKNISDAIGRINRKYVDEATSYTGRKKISRHNGWLKWSGAAACFVLAAALGIGIFQGDLFGAKEQISTLDNGDEIRFIKSDAGSGQLDIAVQIETRDLTESELGLLFKDMPVTAHVVFNADDGDAIGLEGRACACKLIVSAPDIMLNDTVIEGEEVTSDVDGVSVRAGYFTNRKNVIYYATFKLGDNTVYVEHAGDKEESETVRSEISYVIQKLIALEEINIAQFSK